MLVMSTLNNSLKFFPVFLPIFHLVLLTLWNLPHLGAREWNWTLRKKIVSGCNFINSFINIYSFWLGDSIKANFKKVSLAVNFFFFFFFYMGSRHAGSVVVAQGLQSAGSAVVAHGPSRSAARGVLPDQGPNPRPPHRQADSQPLCHQGSPLAVNFFMRINIFKKLAKSKTPVH